MQPGAEWCAGKNEGCDRRADDIKKHDNRCRIGVGPNEWQPGEGDEGTGHDGNPGSRDQPFTPSIGDMHFETGYLRMRHCQEPDVCRRRDR